ncbi:MAG: H-X9-DG-CTERM domain-containing protein [Planctomycetota bacterium]|jgi:prepilin-type processing-associated H-X9-DG protein
MRQKTGPTKADISGFVVCAVFLLASLGSIGGGGRRRAKEAVCVSNLKRWGVILQTFANDNGGYFMDRSEAAGWVEDMLPMYCENPRMLLCPEATRTFQEGGRNPFMAWGDYVDEVYYRGSYGINRWIADETDGRNPELFWRTPYVANAADVPMVLDSQWKAGDPYPFDEPAGFETDVWVPYVDDMQRYCVNRHNGGVNAVFLDGSVRKVGLKFLWLLEWHREWPEDFPLPVWPPWMTNFKDVPR